MKKYSNTQIDSGYAYDAHQQGAWTASATPRAAVDDDFVGDVNRTFHVADDGPDIVMTEKYLHIPVPDWLKYGEWFVDEKGDFGLTRDKHFFVLKVEDVTQEDVANGTNIVHFAGDVDAAKGKNYSLSVTFILDDMAGLRAGADNLNGDKKANILNGYGDNDSINGKAGNDRIEGGEGNDTLTGGAGRDTFIFDDNSGRDTVRDFNWREDSIIDNGVTLTNAQEKHYFDNVNGKFVHEAQPPVDIANDDFNFAF